MFSQDCSSNTLLSSLAPPWLPAWDWRAEFVPGGYCSWALPRSPFFWQRATSERRGNKLIGLNHERNFGKLFYEKKNLAWTCQKMEKTRKRTSYHMESIIKEEKIHCIRDIYLSKILHRSECMRINNTAENCKVLWKTNDLAINFGLSLHWKDKEISTTGTRLFSIFKKTMRITISSAQLAEWHYKSSDKFFIWNGKAKMRKKPSR